MQFFPKIKYICTLKVSCKMKKGITIVICIDKKQIVGDENLDGWKMC